MSERNPPPSYIKRYDDEETPFQNLIHRKNYVRRLRNSEEESFIGLGPRPSLATTSQAVVSDALSTTAALWFLSLTNVTANTGHGTALSDQSDATHAIAKGYKQLYSTVVRVPDRTTNIPDSRRVALPILSNANPRDLANGNLTYEGLFSEKVAEKIEHPDLFFYQLLETAGPTSDYRLRWIDLPDHVFHGSSIGAAILLPQSEGNTDQDLFFYNLSAGWGLTALEVESRHGGIDTVSSRPLKINLTDIGEPASIKLTNIPSAEAGSDDRDWSEYRYPSFPTQLINISGSWAQYLNPSVENLNTTLINGLMQQSSGILPKYLFASHLLGSLIVNGLSRTSWYSLIQGDVKSVGSGQDESLDGN
ncbi:MAG: hypothetical protein Q9170_003600 [Blastenia crenularia]